MASASAIPLLTNWEEYIGQDPQGDLMGFAKWVLSRASGPASSGSASTGSWSPASPFPTSHSPKAPAPPGSFHSPGSVSLAAAIPLDDTAQATLLITRLSRILRAMAKPALKGLGFTKEMEFGLLVQVSLMDRPNKKELCHQLLIEPSTGVEMAKRLVRKNFLKEATDPNDRRASRLSLTEKGKAILLGGFKKLASTHQGFLNPLNEEEKQTLVLLMARLNDFHNAILEEDPAAGFID